MVIVPIVDLGISRLGFWSGNLFLIAPFPDRCLLIPFKNSGHINENGNGPYRGFGFDLFLLHIFKIENYFQESAIFLQHIIVYVIPCFHSSWPTMRTKKYESEMMIMMMMMMMMMMMLTFAEAESETRTV